MADARPKVAFIDDSETVRLVLADILERAGCEHFECTCWADLEAAVQQHDLDLVLLDVQMPKVSGAPMALVLKKTRPNLTVVYHSDQDERFLRELTEKTGADGYIRKSVDPEETLGAIEQYLSR
ncbi:MAG: response regulator [Deltaproteobacteria bacterium]|jgi:DNA-binding NarL/FixJ family response regulator|nr:response regulator [Deltaproteobacteria bacterium]MBW2530233.1 response regulator [Deltaproteobacteria bacterium]